MDDNSSDFVSRNNFQTLYGEISDFVSLDLVSWTLCPGAISDSWYYVLKKWHISYNMVNNSNDFSDISKYFCLISNLTNVFIAENLLKYQFNNMNFCPMPTFSKFWTKNIFNIILLTFLKSQVFLNKYQFVFIYNLKKEN